MKCFYHPEQQRHAPPSFLLRGRQTASPEGPLRAEMLLEGLGLLGIETLAPMATSQLHERLSRVHTPRYLTFLETIYERWAALPDTAEMVAPNVHPCGQGYHYPRHPVGQAGWHMHDMACPLTADTYAGIIASATSAEAATEAVLAGDGQAYAMCRPPGHHAGPDRAGGFCFLNSSALAAEILREKYARVAILDVDLHHGNGTQDVFYARGDVWTGSVHADTADFYPFFWGGVDEIGEGDGQGANVNQPLPLGSDGPMFMQALEKLIDAMQAFKPQALVIALGLDAHKDDPLAGLALETEDFGLLGKRLAEIPLPTVVVQEGGYPTEHLGRNLAAFMDGFIKT
ncbi:histone deacetylase family protein [Vreelandella rituensis]|uniref:Histone deacetylase family protein n=1 Tax=Vreelandella rituensis TaxID=2282306 RepID=A0A368U7E2_9GAMM|nr:histone deacetylase family protein [Halomonas rituensis]RCV92357.1 histone deacetylase family protein [Halomonas rituensis]